MPRLRRALHPSLVRVHLARATIPSPPIRECSAAAQLARATIPTLPTRARNALVLLAVPAAEFLVRVPLAPAHRGPERHDLALLAQVDPVRVHVPAALDSVQAAQAAAEARAQQALVAVLVPVAHPEATLVLTVRPVAVAVEAQVVELQVHSVAVAARARHASRSARSGQSSS